MAQGELPARIRAARGWAKLSQPQLAKEVGVDTSTVKRWENPKVRTKIDWPWLDAIAKVTGVPRWFIHHGWVGMNGAKPDDQAAVLGEDEARHTRATLQGVDTEPPGDHPGTQGH